MIQKQILQKTMDFVKSRLQNDFSGHDWWHIYRVWKVSLQLAKEENANLFVVQLAALLHDIADWKFTGGDHQKGIAISDEWLSSLGVENDIKQHVCQIISDISYKGAGVATPMKSIEGMVVQDADRLDAMGAIGIARTFAYGGSKGREMHHPDSKPLMHETFEAYKKNQGTTINHFYEKLFLLRDRMNTKTAANLAKTRHKLMEDFITQFLREWEGTT
jgi:uncharacterized protein